MAYGSMRNRRNRAVTRSYPYPRHAPSRGGLLNTVAAAGRVLSSPGVARAMRTVASYVSGSRSVESSSTNTRNFYGRRAAKAKRRVRIGVRGRAGKSFGRMRKTKMPSVLKYGAMTKHTARDVASATAASHLPVVLGHSTFCFTEFVDTLMYAIVRRMFDKAGVQVAGLNDALGRIGATGNIGRCVITFSQQEMGNEGNVSTQVTVTSTIRSVATALWDQLEPFFDYTADNAYHMRFRRMYYYREFADPVSGVATAKDPDAELDLENAVAYVTLSSTLAMQNRTEATTEATEDNDNATSVEANPLKVTGYQTNSNGFIARYVSPQGMSAFQFTGNRDGGVINPNLSTQPTSFKEAYGNPPPAKGFKYTTREKSYVIQPGEVRQSYLSYNRKLSLNYLLRLILPTTRGSLTGTIVVHSFFGNSKMYYFNKLCDTGSVEPNINVGWEHNYTVGISIMIKPRFMMPHNTEFE